MGGELVQAIIANLAQLLPWRIVMSYNVAVRWTWGAKPKALGPGFHWAWWFVHHIQQVSAVEEVINLAPQSVTTADDKCVVFSCNLGLKVTDPVAHVCNVHDFANSSRDLAMTHLSKRVRAMTYAELTTGLDALEQSLRGTMSTQWKDWGTVCTRVGFTDFAHTRAPIRLFTDQPVRIG